MPMYRVRSIATGVTGSPYITNHFFEAGPGNEQVVVDRVRDFWDATKGMQVTGLSTTVQGLVDEIDPATGAIVAAHPVTSRVVNANGGPAPAAWATQGLIRWRTGYYLGGRQVQGKTFVPGMLAAQIVGGRPSSNILTAFTNAANALVGTGAPPLVIWSRKHGVNVEVQNGSPWTEFAVLRSRRD